MKKIITFFIATLITLNIAYAANNSIYDYYANATARNLNFTALTNNILGILTWFGVLAALCIILVTGIQFLTANAQKRAQLKEKLWLIGLGVVILALGIPLFKVIFSLINEIRTSLMSGI